MTDPTSPASSSPRGERRLSPRGSRRPRSDDRDYAQFKARVTEVVNQQHTVSPSSFTSRGRRYAKLRKQKLLASSSLRQKQKQRESSEQQQPGSFSLDKDIDFFCDEDRGDMPSTIRECSESSSASQTNEKRSSLKDQVDHVLSNVKKLQQNHSSDGKDAKNQKTQFLDSDMHNMEWATMEQFDDPRLERSCFENIGTNNDNDHRSSPFSSPFRSNASGVAPDTRRNKSSSSRRSRAGESPAVVSPRSTTSTRTPRSALSPPRDAVIRSPKSVCSTKTGASKSFFSAGESVFSGATNVSRRSRSSSPSRSPGRSTTTSRSRSASPARSMFSKLGGSSTYKPLTPDSGGARNVVTADDVGEESSFLMVPTLQHAEEPMLPMVSPDSQPQQDQRGTSLIFRDFFQEETPTLEEAANNRAVQTITPVHVPSSQREENFFEELQRPSPDLSQFLPKSCTLSGTDGEEGDVDVLNKVTISTTNGIRVKREDDGSPVDRQIVEHILAQLAREEREEEAIAAELSPRSGRQRQRRKPDPEPVQEVVSQEGFEDQEEVYEQAVITPPRQDEYSVQDPPSDHFEDLPSSPPSIRRVRLEEAEEQGEREVWYDEPQQVIENHDNVPMDHQGINTAIDYLCHKADPSSHMEFPRPAVPEPDYEPYHSSLPPVTERGHPQRDSFENHPLVALSTTDSSSVPYTSQVHYLQPQLMTPYESFHSSTAATAATAGSTLESLKSREERMARTYREKSRSIHRKRSPKRARQGGATSSKYTIEESYESFETYETSKGFCAAFTAPIASAFFCKCMGDIPPPPKQRAARGENETFDSASYIQTTYGRPLPILSASNLSIEDDDMFDVVERCFCG